MTLLIMHAGERRKIEVKLGAAEKPKGEGDAAETGIKPPEEGELF